MSNEEKYENKFQDTVGSLFRGMDAFISAKTVVGEPIHIGETIILPLSPVDLRVLSKNAIALSPYTFFSVIILLDMFLMAGILSSTL